MGEGSSLPPGFQFFPSDEELVVHFLHRKAALLPCRPDIIPTIDLHHFDPWDLGALQGGNHHWYFFTRTTQRRATANGYWQAVGTDHETIASSCVDVGVKKTLGYYLGEAPEGVKTNWLMHEYHLLDDGVLHGTGDGSRRKKVSDSAQAIQEPRLVHSTATITVQESNRWVVCRVYESTGGSQSSFHDDDGGSELSCLDEIVGAGAIRCRSRRLPLPSLRPIRRPAAHAPPATTPTFIPKEQFIRYLDGYAARFRRNPELRTQVEVAKYDGRAGGWIVRARDTVTGEEKLYKGRFLVMATGENGEGRSAPRWVAQLPRRRFPLVELQVGGLRTRGSASWSLAAATPGWR
ncbi:hypothetical protein BHE74_00009153 [Ensete ventricosum]|nr:hypothetical protein BHE74_00009153 [Ensete ventricosum]